MCQGFTKFVLGSHKDVTWLSLWGYLSLSWACNEVYTRTLSVLTWVRLGSALGLFRDLYCECLLGPTWVSLGFHKGLIKVQLGFH